MKPRSLLTCLCRGVWPITLALAARASGQEELKLLPVLTPPLFGTFFSMQRPDYPPFPFPPFPELPLYESGIKHVYWFDDRLVDYAAWRAASAAESASGVMASASGVMLAGGTGGGTMLMSGGGGNGPYSEPGLKVIIQGVTNGTAYLSIADGQGGVPYDFFGTTNLIGGSILESSWSWLGQGFTEQTYFFTNEPSPRRFYVLGTPQNADGDAWTDAYEQLVSKTDPYQGLPPFNIVITHPTSSSLLP